MSEGYSFETEQLNEKCAVAAAYIYNDEYLASDLVREELKATQHRGQDSTGMVSITKHGELVHNRGFGLAAQVHTDKEILKLDGNQVIGHNRYSTSGKKNKHLQPCVDTPLGFSFAHNGNIPDTSSLEHYLEGHNMHPDYFNDSEMMSLTIAQYIREGCSLPQAVEKSIPYFTGAYSCVAMHDDLIVAFRDPNGIRPLEIGKINNSGYVVSSETCGLKKTGANHEFSVEPGEMVVIDKRGLERVKFSESNPKLDMFEIVYFSRHDSRLYDKSVAGMRRNFGKILARAHPPITDSAENILVIGVPDTSTYAAEGYAKELGLNHSQSIIKDRYSASGRSFISASHEDRQKLLHSKHSYIEDDIKGKDLIIIDDSIVRLNTFPRLVQAAKSIGAKSVMTLVASAPVRFPDFYGIDTPRQDELAAANMTMETIREAMGSEYLGYLSVSQMVEATGIDGELFNLSCFTGEYPIDIGRKIKEIRRPVSTEYMD